MTNNKFTKRALISSVLSILTCVAMLIGTTFAWFTDTASTAVNKIQAGTLDVALEMSNDGTTWESAEGKTLTFKTPDNRAADQIFWEPGCTYELPQLRVVNKGTLALKYKVQITGIKGNAKLNEVIDWTNDGITLGNTFTSLAVGASNEFTIKGHMQETAGNEYKGLTIDGIGITVYATQDTVEKDSIDDQYDKDAGKDTVFYTLAEFNALTEIPEGVKNVYLDIGDVSLADGDVTIGNKDICDIWTWDTNTNHTVGEILEDGRKVYMVRENDTIYSSNKAGITLYISGSVRDNPEGGLNQSNSHAINFKIPDNSNVVFTNAFTMNGYFRMNTGWADGRNLGGAFYNRTVKSVLFDHSTFNGIWIQNGGFFADSLTLDGCTFNAYQNKVSANDSNPLWFCNIRTCDVTVKNCTFKASRPIKVVEQYVDGANVTITGNKFDMSLTNSANDAAKPKNDAIMFSTITNTSTLGNVVVSGNEVTGANALLTFFNPSQITMATGATFKVSDNNVLNGAKPSVEWKTTTEYKPDFVIYDESSATNEFKQGVTISGIAGVAASYSTIQEAYDAVKAMLVANSGLAEQSLSAEAFNAFFTDGGKITWTIYSNQKVTDTRMFSFGRAANRFGEGLHITEINIIGGNSSAYLDLSEVAGTFALPYNWWNVADSVNTALKCKNITFNGIKSMPSATFQCNLYPTTYEFDGCTFNGELYSYQNFDVNMTIKNCTFNAPANTKYAFMSQGNGGTITLDNNVFNNYTRGINLQRATADFIVTNNTIVSTVSEPDRAAIQLTDGKSFVVNGNKVNVNAGNAFWFHSAATNTAVTYEIKNNDIKAPYIGYSGVTAFDVNEKITSSGNNFYSTDTTKCMKKDATVAEATNLTAIQ